jgi:hypothetical protein
MLLTDTGAVAKTIAYTKMVVTYFYFAPNFTLFVFDNGNP